MTIDATPSQTSEPVSWCSPMPANATMRPISAAESSKSTVFGVGSSISRRYAQNDRFSALDSRTVCRTACTHDVPSSRNATASTM